MFLSISRVLPATVAISFPSGGGRVYSIVNLSRKDEQEIWRSMFRGDISVPGHMKTREDGSIDCLPENIQIENTTKCNLRCRMCPQSLGSIETKNMRLADFARILPGLGKPSSIMIQGTGEPLCDPHFFAKVRLARDSGCGDVATTTNGLLLHDRNCDKLFTSGVSTVNVSIDSPEKISYEAIRVGASWEILQKNLQYLCAHSERNTIKINIMCVAQPEAMPFLPDLIDFARGAHANQIHFNFDVNFWGDENLKEAMEKEDRLTAGSFASYRSIMARAHEAGMPCTVYMRVPELVPATKGHCPYFLNTASITADGWVTPCCRARAIPGFTMGNVFQEPFHAIWNGERYKKFRQSWLQGKPPAACARTCYPQLQPRTADRNVKSG